MLSILREENMFRLVLQAVFVLLNWSFAPVVLNKI